MSARIVALGGGHGLYATLSAARRLTPHVTAVVTVADDGGSSGRLRDEFGNTRMLHIPMQHVLRIEEVEKKGQSAIRDAATGETVVTPFPMPAKPR